MEWCASLSEIYHSSFPFVVTMVGIGSAILSPITVCLNTLLMASFIAKKQVSQNTSNFLIMFLCLSDLVNGAVAMPLLASILLSNHGKTRCIRSTIGNLTFYFFNFLSATITVLIAIDRYLNMNPHLERQSRLYKVFQKPQIYYLLAFVAISMLAFSLANVLLSREFSVNLGLLIIANVILFTAAISVVATLYIKGYIRIRKFTEASPIYRERNATRPQYVRNLYRSVLVLVLVMMLIYVPLCMATIAVLIDVLMGSGNVSRVAYSINFSSTLLLYLNCTINVLVVLWFNNVAKQWVLRKIRSCFSKRITKTVNISNDVGVAGVSQNQSIAVVGHSSGI